MLTKSGYVDVRQGARFTAPAVRTVKDKLKFSGKLHEITHHDGVTFYVTSRKTTKGIELLSGVMSLKITDGVAHGTESYVALKDGFSAHGSTVKKAISDLQFKIQSEKLRNEPLTMDTVMTDNHYRLVTGACELGVKEWKKQNHVNVSEITLRELLPLLEKTNAYGLSKIKSLIKE